MRRLPLILALLLAAVAVLATAGCGGAKKDKASAAPPASTTTQASANGCSKVGEPAPKGAQHLPKPKLRLDRDQTWTATVTTNCGAFTITLDVHDSPKTSSSFAWLARKGFYDGLTFHRIAPGFVIQGGDPLGDGTGGPGYGIVEPPPGNVQYTHGVVAMAKTATDPDGASGSQFFVVTGTDAGLPAQYALLGNVTDGLDVVDRIGALELQTSDPQGGPPIDPVVIDSVEIAGG